MIHILLILLYEKLMKPWLKWRSISGYQVGLKWPKNFTVRNRVSASWWRLKMAYLQFSPQIFNCVQYSPCVVDRKQLIRTCFLIFQRKLEMEYKIGDVKWNTFFPSKQPLYASTKLHNIMMFLVIQTCWPQCVLLSTLGAVVNSISCCAGLTLLP